MGLLDRGPGYEDCVVVMESHRLDADGNTITEAKGTRIPTLGRFQVQNQSGTSSRRAESDDEGFATEKVYNVRFTRAFDRQYGELGAESTVEWGVDAKNRPAVYEIFGDVLRYKSSRRTAHNTYTLRRY